MASFDWNDVPDPNKKKKQKKKKNIKVITVGAPWSFLWYAALLLFSYAHGE